MGDFLYSKDYIDFKKIELSTRINSLKQKRGRVPSLTVVLVGDNRASLSYVRRKDKLAKEIGMSSQIVKFRKEISEKELLSKIDEINNDDSIDGVIVQLPLPAHISVNKIIDSISPEKDVDGFHPVNLGKLFRGEDALYPCTPLGIVNFLKYKKLSLEGKNGVILGRSNIVGKPLFFLLLKENMTITITHSKTKNLKEICSKTDFLFAAVGKPLIINKDYVKEGAIVVDVGVNAIDNEKIITKVFSKHPKKIEQFKKKGYVLTGDVHPDVVLKAKYLTPVPGGVGPLTVITLLENTVKALEKKQK
jgi:methylenetetrahydrofolate dehydrogenase (NADP+)/methenyltetrahydrofolate cyclohydrolase